MKILICGGRDFDDWGLFTRTMIDVLNQRTSATNKPIFISGGARGADQFIRDMAKAWGLPCEVYMADWNKHGKKAGSIRNQQMLDEGKPDLVIAFPTPKSIGTWDMVRRAQKANIEIIIVEANGLITKDFI